MAAAHSSLSIGPFIVLFGVYKDKFTSETRSGNGESVYNSSKSGVIREKAHIAAAGRLWL
jgi:hypothetical protein